ncbi:DUF760 domain-containing protein [Oscillatoria sp. FACHB-1406]|nr:DUF760 domain-containing protein [Oscillatoria sp. FACHB-1406]MBD2580172.1 DUF760 domain-containing protein [Oscillatoria sp. FACHB-1406]
MQNLPNRLNRFLDNASEMDNALESYIQSLSAEAIAQLSKPNPEALHVMERNIISMLGGLPSEHFEVTISTSRENLGRLLASAMMSGYFLNNAQQRMELEKSFQ